MSHDFNVKTRSMPDEIRVSRDDLDRFLATDTWKALKQALEERQDEITDTLADPMTDDRGIRVAQGRNMEMDYWLEFPDRLRQQIEDEAKLEEEMKHGSE